MSGDGYGSPVVGGGGELIRDKIRSRDFDGTSEAQPGTLGWGIFKNGLAIFNQLVARGDITAERLMTGVAPNARVVIDSVPAGFPTVEFFTGNPGEVSEGTVGHTSFPFGAVLYLVSADLGAGLASLELRSPVGATPATLVYDDSGSALVPVVDFSAADVRARTLSSPSMRHLKYDAPGVVTTTSTVYGTHANGPGGAFPFPPSGTATFLFSADCENSLNNFANATIQIRQTNAAGAILYGPTLGGGFARILHQGVSGREVITCADVVTGLPTTGTGWAELVFLSSAGANTATFRNSFIIVQPSP